MSLNGVSGKAFYEKMNSRYSAGQRAKEESGGAFSGNLKGVRAQEQTEQKEVSGSNVKASVEVSYAMTAKELFLQQNGRVKMQAAMECGVRRISYEESDYVKLFATEGFTLKAQVDVDAHRVYIEQKNEDGTYQAYEVNPLLVGEKTKSPIERTALEAWEMARELFNDGMASEWKSEVPSGNPLARRSSSDGAKEAENEEEAGPGDGNMELFLERLEEFKAFVKKRVKEGPPKIEIGASAFSEEEWEQLMAKIDQEIDAHKEEIRERIRKRAGQPAEGKAAGSATQAKSLAETAGVEAPVKKEEGPLSAKGEEPLEETSLQQPTAYKEQRGSSFLARLSGEKRAPYSYMADETGMILYNGVTFVCDDEKQQICLGDVSNPKEVLSIPLSGGGCLKVNRNNLGDLAKAIGMFSAEDIGRILRAIAKDNKVREFELYLEEVRKEAAQ